MRRNPHARHPIRHGTVRYVLVLVRQSMAIKTTLCSPSSSHHTSSHKSTILHVPKKLCTRERTKQTKQSFHTNSRKNQSMKWYAAGQPTNKSAMGGTAESNAAAQNEGRTATQQEQNKSLDASILILKRKSYVPYGSTPGEVLQQLNPRKHAVGGSLVFSCRHAYSAPNTRIKKRRTSGTYPTFSKKIWSASSARQRLARPLISQRPFQQYCTPHLTLTCDSSNASSKQQPAVDFFSYTHAVSIRL